LAFVVCVAGKTAAPDPGCTKDSNGQCERNVVVSCTPTTGPCSFVSTVKAKHTGDRIEFHAYTGPFGRVNMRIRYFSKQADGVEHSKFAVRFHSLVEFVECGSPTCMPTNGTCGPAGYDTTDCVTPNGVILLHGLETVGVARQANWIYDCSEATSSSGSAFAVTVSSTGLPTVGNTNLISIKLTSTSSSTSDAANGVMTKPTHAKFDIVINPIWTTTTSKLALVSRIDHRPLPSGSGSATVTPTSTEGGNEKELICTDATCESYHKFSQCWTTGVNGVAATPCAPAAAGQCASVTPGCFQIIRSVISLSTDPADSMERDSDEISDLVSFTFDQGTAAQPSQIVWDPTVAGPNGMNPSSASTVAPVAAFLVVLVALLA